MKKPVFQPEIYFLETSMFALLDYGSTTGYHISFSHSGFLFYRNCYLGRFIVTGGRSEMVGGTI